MFIFSLRNINLPYVNKYLSQLKYFHFKSNYASVNFNYKNTKKGNKLNGKHKIHLLFDSSFNVYDKLILFKNLPKSKAKKCEEIDDKEAYKYLLSEYNKWFNFMSFHEIIETIKIFDEIDKKINDCNFYIVKNIDKNVLNKVNKYKFREKDIYFHRREIIGKICNKLIKCIHTMSGNELIHFIVYFFRWNKNDKHLILFYNFYFNHVFDHLFLFDHEIYKILFILNNYLINNNSNMIFNKSLMDTNIYNFYYFRELKNQEDYIIKMKKEEIYKNCLPKLYENIDKIDNNKLLNILKLYIDNSILNVNINEKIFYNLHKDLMNQNLEYLVKLLNIYSTIIKKQMCENDLISFHIKKLILSVHQILREKKYKKKVLCDITYSTILNSVNNKKILSKIVDENFVLFYEYLLEILLNVKFLNIHSLSISLISIKNIYFTLLKNKHSFDNTLFYDVMKYSLCLSNKFLENYIKMENKNALHILSNGKIENNVNLEDVKEVNIEKKKEYFFYMIENYSDFKFKLKNTDLLSVKILSNSFVKIDNLYNSHDFYLLFNNISCILYYFLVNKNITKFNDTYIYILNDLSYVYKHIDQHRNNNTFLPDYIKKLICTNILKVSNIYIKNFYEEENGFLKDQYVCSLVFLNNLFFDKIVIFDSIYKIWCHIYKAYNYFKKNKLLNEDIISLLLLTCSKFQFFIENNMNDRYCRKEVMNLKYNIINDITRNHLNKCKYISLDNFSKIFISLSNSKYTCEINEDLLLKSLQNEIVKIKGLKKDNYINNNSSKDINSSKTFENTYFENIKHELFLNFTKIIECLIKMDVFLYFKKRNTYLYMYKSIFCYVHLKKNILKKLLYIANNLYVYQIYSYVCEILEKSLEDKLCSYNFKNNIENKVFEKIICFISEDDYIEYSNTIFIIFYDYLLNLYFLDGGENNNNKLKNVEKNKNILNFLSRSKSNTYSIEIKHEYNKQIDILNNNVMIKQSNMEKDINNTIEKIINNNNITYINNCSKRGTSNNYNKKIINSNILKKQGNKIYDIMNLLKFLKIDKNKLIFFQLYVYLYNIKNFKKANTSSMFHMEVFSVLKNMNSTYLENFKIKNEESAFLYTVDIVLYKI